MLTAALFASPVFATKTHRAITSNHAKAARKTIGKAHKLHGQQAIEPERVTQIQTALVREHYLTADPNGQWNDATEAAMRKYQADQGWQTKLMPDSRALKKLGLGPDYSGAINARNSTFDAPPPVTTIPTEQAAGFTQGSGVTQ
jgi:hypothetical protein